MAQQFPQQFGPYTLHELIARGGMAEVYRATMPGIGGFEKTVAIKKILPHLAENEEFITMLKDEANIIVSINHSNIAQVYDLGKIDDTYYIAMEYVHGIDASTILKVMARQERFLPLEHAIYICSCICAGLHIAHSKTDENGSPLNIVHRDVSPHNVLLSFAGDVKVIDFGVAKASVKDAHTKMGVIKGKLLYMAPEQAMAKQIDGRADLFAVGLILYKMLTHRLPFEGENEFQIYNNILSKDITPPKAFNESIPDELNAIAMKFLERDPDKRYQDGYSAKSELDRALHKIAPGYTINRLSRYLEDNFSNLSRPQSSSSSSHSSGSFVNPQSTTEDSNSSSNSTVELQEVVPAPIIEHPQDNDTVDTVDTVDMAAKIASSASHSALNIPDSSEHTGSQATPSGVALQPPAHANLSVQDGFSSTEELYGLKSTTPTAQVSEDIESSDSRSFRETITQIPPAIFGIVAMLLTIAMLLLMVLLSSDDEAPQDNISAPSSDTVQAHAPTELSSRITFSLDTKPSGADLYRRNEFVGTTPIVMRLPRSNDPIDFQIKMEGFQTKNLPLTPTKDTDLELTLSALEKQAEAAPEDARDPEVRSASERNSNTRPAAPAQEIRRQPQMLDIRTRPPVLSSRPKQEKRDDESIDESSSHGDSPADPSGASRQGSLKIKIDRLD